MTNKQARERLAYWQKVLRLQDWRIHVEMVDSEDIEGNSGQCHVHQRTKTAVIKLLKPEAFNLTSTFSKVFPDCIDPEVTLVHELLHIHFDGLFVEDDKDDIREDREEVGLELVASALLRLERS